MTISWHQRDLPRQAANVAGALFQVGMTAVAASSIQAVTDQATPLIEPALYAFFVWGPIFGLSLAYALYQALPANRENPLLRRVGWFTAPAFAACGLWSVFVPQNRLRLALTMLAAIFVCLLVAYLRLAEAGRRHAWTAGERWLVALPVGIFLGWMTAANAVSASSELVRGGLLAAGGTGEAVGGGLLLLLLGGALAALIVRGGATGPAQAALAYGGTVLWALVGVVAQQYDASALTTGAAVVAAVPVVLALLERGRRCLPRQGGAAASGATA